MPKLIGSRFRVPGSRVTTYWHYLQLQPNAGLSLFHPLGENYLPPLWRRNSFGLSLLGFINPEPLAQTWFQEVGSKAHTFNSRGLISLIMVVAPGRAWTLNRSTQVMDKRLLGIYHIAQYCAINILLYLRIIACFLSKSFLFCERKVHPRRLWSALLFG